MERTSAFSSAWGVHHILPHSDFEKFKQAGIEDMHAQLLHNRGITTVEAMHSFLEARYDLTPDPLTLIDMPRAVERIQRALTGREHITVYGDYDADGVTSSALLFRALRTLKHPDATLDFHIPSRLHDGCGLNFKALEELKERGTSLIITTDCASSDVEQVAYAGKLAMDVIITDHHQPPDQLPTAYAMVNPWRPGCTYEEKYLCGVGIAFKLVQALYRAYGHPQTEELALLDLVAVGTIADLAPLLGENHTLVRLGLHALNATRKPGLLALVQRANLKMGHIRERDVAYALAPRINAAGRMKDAGIAFKLLTADDPSEAAHYVEELEVLNLSRQRQTEELMHSVRSEALARPDDAVVLVSGENWPEGILGLVAGKLSDELHRSVLVLSKGPEFSRGSARSQQGLNIISALRDCAAILERYGGHAQAAGFTIANTRIEELRTHLLSWQTQVTPSGAVATDAPGLPEQTAVPKEQESIASLDDTTRMVDIIFTKLERINYNLYQKLRVLAPFGVANPEPVFKIERLRIQSSWQSGADRRTLSLTLGNGNIQFKGKLLRGAAHITSFPRGQLVNVIFCLEPAWIPIDDASKQEIWLKILHLEALT